MANQNDREDAPIIVAATELKLPTFWTTNPEVWFLRAEAQFRKITKQSSKFDKVILALDESTAARVLEMIRNPPENPYDALKAKLLAKYDLSDYERAIKILDMPALEDEKPSLLMDRMTSVIGSRHRADDCFIFRANFIRKLPEDIRAILAGERFDTCGDLATRADMIWLGRRASENTSSAICLATNGIDTNEVSKKTNKPAASFSEFARKFELRPNGPCVFHAFYREKALKCKTPCNWQENATASHQ